MTVYEEECKRFGALLSGGELRNAAVHLPLPCGDLRKGQVVVKGDFYKKTTFSKGIIQFCAVCRIVKHFSIFIW
jgi:hypothetical protein